MLSHSSIHVFILALFAVFALTGCETRTATMGKPLPAMTFAHLEATPVNVGMLKTDHNQENITGESFVVSPDDALERYLHSRFQPVGFDGALVATIKEATVKHSYEPSPLTAAKALKVDGLDVYDMLILLGLEHRRADESIDYGTVLTVRRIVKVSEHASISARERAQYEAMEQLFRDLDREVLRIVLGDMALGVRSAKVHRNN